jgi:thiamine pyrophosphate-dependent acetolactate synthase large subunit-like protein
MKDKPASTLLHLGPGLANGLANIHNAKRASVGHGQHRRRAFGRATSNTTRR